MIQKWLDKKAENNMREGGRPNKIAELQERPNTMKRLNIMKPNYTEKRPNTKVTEFNNPVPHEDRNHHATATVTQSSQLKDKHRCHPVTSFCCRYRCCLP